MLAFCAGAAVTRPSPGSSDSEQFNFHWDHMWNLPQAAPHAAIQAQAGPPMRCSLGDSAAWSHSPSTTFCHGKKMVCSPPS